MTSQANLTLRFIVRVWLEPQADGLGTWRGEVEAVPEQEGLRERTYFQDGRGLLRILRSRLRAAGGPVLPDSAKSSTPRGSRRI